MSASRRTDVSRSAAGQAHRDALDGDTGRSASLYGHHPRTSRRWMDSGPPQAVEFALYLSSCPDPWRWEAHMKATAKMRTLEKLTTEQLVERIRALREREKGLEGEDNVNDIRRGMGWLDRAAQKERDAAVNEELAAAFRICAARGLEEDEVL